MCDIDWDTLRAEYIADEKTSYRKLEEKYGVNYKVIQKRGKAEGWQELRSQANHNAITKTVGEVTDSKAARAEKVIRIYDLVLDELEQALQDERAAKGRITVTSIDNAMEAIGRYQAGMGIVLGHNAERAQAELEKLRREANAAEEGSSKIVVQMEGIGDLIG